MKQESSEDIVNHVLECFTGAAGHVDHHRLPLKEVIKRYHSRHTLSFFDKVLKKIIWRKKNEREIRRALNALVEAKLIEMQLLYYTDRPLRVGVKYCSLTQEGINHLGQRAHKKKK